MTITQAAHRPDGMAEYAPWQLRKRKPRGEPKPPPKPKRTPPPAMSYREYMASDLWQRRRRKVLRRDKWRCVLCGKRAVNVHHKKYPKRFETEKLRNLVSLCGTCHVGEHGIPHKDNEVPWNPQTWASPPTQDRRTP